MKSPEEIAADLAAADRGELELVLAFIIPPGRQLPELLQETGAVERSCAWCDVACWVTPATVRLLEAGLRAVTVCSTCVAHATAEACQRC